MEEKHLTNGNVPQQKKAWQKPEFYLLGTDNVHATKHLPKIHEGTAVLSDGHLPTTPPNYYGNGNNTNYYQIKSHKPSFLS